MGEHRSRNKSVCGTADYAIKKNRERRDKPNEDFILADDANSIYIVCDGVTRSPVKGKYPHHSPSAQAARIFAEVARHVLVETLPFVSPPQALIKAVEKGNDGIAEFNRHEFESIDYLENDLAGTVAIVGVIAGDVFHYASIGDCLGYIVSNDKSVGFTHSQTEMVAAYRRKVGFVRDATLRIRRDIRNNKAHPWGFGVLTGESAALDFVEQGDIALHGGETIILASDGVAHLFQSSVQFGDGVVAGLLIQRAERAEKELGIRSDDKAVIVIRISQSDEMEHIDSSAHHHNRYS